MFFVYDINLPSTYMIKLYMCLKADSYDHSENCSKVRPFGAFFPRYIHHHTGLL